jgi:PAS domain S-box-containing protein
LALRNHQIELELQNDELRRVQDELVEIRDRYVDLYDFAPVGYLTLNDNNLIEEANLTLAELLGESRKALLAQPFSRFVFQCHEDQTVYAKHFGELIDLKDRHECELRMRRKDGAWFWARLECVAKANSDNGGISIRVALHDITERKHMETEIINAKKIEATALLAGGIAHDFNNLLAVILGNLEMAQEDMLLSGPAINKKMVDAREACLAAGQLTKKFLTFSSGGDPFRVITNVKALIKDSVALNLAGSKVDSEYAFPDDLWPVEVDAGQISKAIGNVIINAREAMPRGGMIGVCAENVDSILTEKPAFQGNQDVKYIKIAIHDEGVGISEDILPQVFDPYFSSKERGQEKGMGLGLSVSYSVIKKHGGFIDIASESDTGTTVYIYLPASNKQIVALEDKARSGVLLNKKILVMDDEEMLRKLTRDVLEMLGYEVEVASDGEEAIQKYLNAQRVDAPFGAVILDLTIKGGMGGQETIKRLHEINPDIIAIVASGYANDPVMSNFKDYGFRDALHKPYQLKDLQNSLM